MTDSLMPLQEDSVSEVIAAEKWLYTVLSASSALTSAVGARIYADVAPATAAFPLVLYAQLSAVDLRPMGPARIFSNMLYVVRGVNETASKTALESIADAIDAALHAASGTTVEGTVYACVRERPFVLAETINTRSFRHLGGVYRIYAK